MGLSCDVIFITPELPPAGGGIGTNAYQIAKGLNALGLATSVIGPLDYVSAQEASHFDEAQSFSIYRLGNHKWKLFQILARLIFISRIIFRNKPGCIISSSWRSGLYSLLPQKVLRIPRISIGHGTEFNFQNPVIKFLSHYIFRKSVKCIAVSRFTKNLMVKGGVLPDKVEVIHNGADPRRFSENNADSELRRKFGLDGKKVLLTVGRMCERKGQDIVLKSLPLILHRMKDVVYMIAGYPENISFLENLAGELGIIQHVCFVPNAAYDDIPRYYSLADVYVLNSRTTRSGDNEGFGISIIEAALCKVPAIGSSGCGIEEAIVDGTTGILVPPDNPEETASAIIQLLQDDLKRREMGKNALKRALEGFTWEHQSKKYFTLVHTLLKTGKQHG